MLDMEMQQQAYNLSEASPGAVRALGAGARDGRPLGALLRDRAAGRHAVHRPPARPGERMRRARSSARRARRVRPVAGTARADGDPASDYLLGQQVFFPYRHEAAGGEAAGAHVDRRRANRRVRDSRRADRERLRPRLGHLALAQAAHLRALSRRRAAVRLQAPAADRDAERVRLLLAEAPGTKEYAVLAKSRSARAPRGCSTSAMSAVQKLAAASGVRIVRAKTPATRRRHRTIAWSSCSPRSRCSRCRAASTRATK